MSSNRLFIGNEHSKRLSDFLRLRKSYLKKISIIKLGEGNSSLSDEERFSDNYFSQAYARLYAKGIGFTVTVHFRNH